MRQTVIGIFNNKSRVDEAINQLEAYGISRNNIDVSRSGTSDNSPSHEDDGSIGRFFSSLFDSDNEANRYSTAVRNNDCMVTVHAESSEEAVRAAEILDSYGAIEIDEQSAHYGDSKLERHLSETESESQTIPVIEEHLEVGKRQVETGRTRIRSRIIERPVEESLRLREEHVHVQRTPVNRPATQSELNNFKDTDIEMTEHSEVPVVSKEARIVEEVRLEKEVEEHDETIRERVRNTEVDVDNVTSNENTFRNEDDFDDPDFRNRSDRY